MARRGKSRGKSKPKRKRGGRRWVWACGTVELPLHVDDGAEAHRPTVYVCVQRPENLVLAAEVADRGADEAVMMTMAVQKAMEAPLVGPPRKPDKIFVRDPAHVEVLRAATGAEVVRGPTPELDLIARTMREHPPAPRSDESTGPESYLAGGRVSPLWVGRMFEAAAALHRCTPWERIDADALIRIDAPELGLRGACAVVTGQMRETYGLMLFSSFDQFVALSRRGPDDESPPDLGSWFLTLELMQGAELPPPLRKEIARHGWKVDGPHAYPWVVRRDPDGTPQPGSNDAMRIASVVAGAVAALVETQGDLTGIGPGDSPRAWTGRIDGMEVGATMPFEARAGEDSAHFHHAMDRELAAGLAAWADDVMPEAYWAHERYFEDVDASENLAESWSVYDYEIDGRTVAEHFLASGESELNAAARAWVEAQGEAWLSIWEASEIVPGEGMTLVDQLTGERRRVVEKLASQTLPERTSLLGRVVTVGELALVVGLHPRVLGPRDAEAVLVKVRKRLRRKSAVPVERLRPMPIQKAMIQAWEAQVRADDARRAGPRILHNTDGEELLMTVDRFSFEPAARARVLAGVSVMRGVEERMEGDPEGEFTLTRPGNAMNPTWDNTIIAAIRVRARHVEVETNSVERADLVRALVETTLGELVRFEVRSHADPMSTAPRDRVPNLQDLTPEERASVVATLREMKAKHYQGWLDQPLPALGHETPRQAARTKAGRQEVELLLREMEHTEGRLPVSERFDVRRLREELGM